MNDKIDLELAEDEDLARAKAWWKENGSSIIGGVLIGTTLVVGYNFWQSYQEKQTQETAQLYERFSASPADDQALSALLSQDQGSAYAHLARLNAAKEAADAGQWQQAEALLNGLLDAGPDQGLRAVAVLRLATVYLAGDKADMAKTLLEDNLNSGLPLMQARAEELLGDIYQLQGETDQARSYYQSSVDLLQQVGQQTQLVQLKLDNL